MNNNIIDTTSEVSYYMKFDKYICEIQIYCDSNKNKKKILYTNML
jgi:hypothetical protein